MRIHGTPHLFYTILRISIGLVFIWASWDKIFNPESFAQIIKNYKILPNVLILPVAIILPWVEMISGIMLVTGYLVKGSAFIINCLMVIFIIALMSNLYRGIDVACGCFSLSARSTDTYLSLIRDVIILCVGIWVLCFEITKTSQTRIN